MRYKIREILCCYKVDNNKNIVPKKVSVTILNIFMTSLYNNHVTHNIHI